MKTAISIPDQIFKQADHLAKKLGVSRSELFTKAIQSYLDLKDQEKITELLNQVYSNKDSSIKQDDIQMQLSSLDHDEW